MSARCLASKALALLVLLHMLAATAQAHSGRSGCHAENDVCVIGAGGSGMRAAVALRDRGYRVLVLERQNRVGGHCDTWTEPTTGQRIDTGVLVYPDQPLITDTFQRFNVTLLRFNILGTTTDGPANPTIDFSGNGSDVYLGPEPSPSPAAFLAAYALWTRLFTERWSFTETTNGAQPDIHSLPSDTRRMLQRPFGDLWSALEVEFGVGCFDGLLPIWNRLTAIGPGSIRDTKALTVLRMFRPSILNIFLGQGFTVDGGCSRIYEAMASYLGDAIKLNVEPFTIRRPYGVSASNPMRVTYTQGNATVRTTCRRLIVSGVQTMQNLRSFLTDVDNKERGVFEQVTANILSKTVVRLAPTPGQLPASAWLIDLRHSALPSTIGLQTYGALPLGMGYTISLSPDQTESQVLDMLYDNLTHWSSVSGGAFRIPANKSDLALDGPDLHLWDPRPRLDSNFSAFNRYLTRLQGHRSTYYTGALLSYNAQYDVWRYSDWLVQSNDWTC